MYHVIYLEMVIYMLYYAATVKLTFEKVSSIKVFSMIKYQLPVCPPPVISKKKLYHIFY